MIDSPMNRSGRWNLRTTSPEGVVVGSLVEAPARGGGSWRWVAFILLALTGAAMATAGVVSHVRSDEKPWSPAQPRIDVHHAAELPAVDLGWVQMRDHLTGTIGANAGHGAALGELLVVADTTLAPRSAFPQHRHAGVEVVTLVLDGTLALEEAGRTVEVEAGSVHVMVAGAGVVHAEANRTGRPVRLLQLWLASPDPTRPPAQDVVAPAAIVDGAPLPLTQLRRDVQIRRVGLAPGATTTWTIAKGRVAYVVAVGGAAALDTHQLADGDGVTLTDGRFDVTAAATGARLVIIELPAPADMILR
jgi:redox-sensitive bicupin YhaK (pirin superfamily)